MQRVSMCIAVMFGLCLTLLSAGCSSFGGRSSAGPGWDETAPAAFSDSVSMEIIRQTQKLQELKTRDYLVGADDVLEISIFEWEMSDDTKTFLFRVSQSGVISLPAIGLITAAGRTVQEIQSEIEKTLSSRNILQNPRVAVAVQEFRSKRIAIVGAVNSPGVYAIHENVSALMDVLTLAGGPSDGAGSVAYILRAQRAETEPIRISVDLEQLFDAGNYELNAVLRGGDVVYVPKAPLVYVYGEVQQPGGFPLRRSLRALEAIALAGGTSDRASGTCRIVRRGDGGEKKRLDVNIGRAEQGKAPNVYLREGDVIYVPASVPLLRAIWDFASRIFTFTYRLDNQ